MNFALSASLLLVSSTLLTGCALSPPTRILFGTGHEQVVSKSASTAHSPVLHVRAGIHPLQGSKSVLERIWDLGGGYSLDQSRGLSFHAVYLEAALFPAVWIKDHNFFRLGLHVAPRYAIDGRRDRAGLGGAFQVSFDAGDSATRRSCGSGDGIIPRGAASGGLYTEASVVEMNALRVWTITAGINLRSPLLLLCPDSRPGR